MQQVRLEGGPGQIREVDGGVRILIGLNTMCPCGLSMYISSRNPPYKSLIEQYQVSQMAADGL